MEISVDRLIPDPKNEELFPLEDLDSITESILTVGIIEPIIISPVGSIDDIKKFEKSDAREVLKSFARFYIRAGHRRVEAAKQLGYKTIPARIAIPLRKGADTLLLIHENLTQRQLSPSTIIKASEIEKKCRPIEFLLPKLPPEIRQAYADGIISEDFIRLLIDKEAPKIKEIIKNLKKLTIIGVKNVSSQEEYERLKKEIEKRDHLISEILQEKEKLENEKKRLQCEKEKLEGSIERLEARIQQFQREKILVLQKLEDLKKEKESILQKTKKVGTTEKTKEELQEKEQEIRKLRSLIKIHENSIQQLKDKLAAEQNKYKLVKQEMNNLVDKEVNKRIEEIKKEFQSTITEIKERLEKEKEQLAEELKKIKDQKEKGSLNNSQSSKKLKFSEYLTPATRVALSFIQNTKSMAQQAIEMEEVCETLMIDKSTTSSNFDLVIEIVVAMEELAKGLLGIADSIRKNYKL